jgi:hypothetical protein
VVLEGVIEEIILVEVPVAVGERVVRGVGVSVAGCDGVAGDGGDVVVMGVPFD